MAEDPFVAQLRAARATMVRLQAEARSGKFTVGDDAKTRTPENIERQVAKFQAAIDDIDIALKSYT